MILYEGIVDTFKKISDEHLQVNYFESGKIVDFQKNNDSKDVIYPAVFLEEGIVNVGMNDSYRGSIIYTLRLWCLDAVERDLSNRTKVKSDCMMILLDYMAAWEQLSALDIELGAFLNKPYTASIDFIQDSNEDATAGAVATIQIKTPLNNKYCEIPINE